MRYYYNNENFLHMLMKERLTEALANKENDIKTFIWKGKKERNADGEYIQESTKMVDLDVATLKKILEKCETMLYNNSKKTPGRTVFLDIIKDAQNRCNVELFLRWLSKENQINRYSFMSIIMTFLSNNPTLKREELTINDIVGKCPLEFQDLPIDLVLDGCMDTLGTFNSKNQRIITNSFVLRQGVWPSEEEKKEFSRNHIKMSVKNILDYLEVNNNHTVRIDSKGLTLKQMKSILGIKDKKYSDMSGMQLELLRNRILFALEREVRFHINQWKNREKQIKLVLASKGVNVN